MDNNREYAYEGRVRSGFPMLALVLALPVLAAALFLFFPFWLMWIPAIVAFMVFVSEIILICGFFVLQPNQARVMIFFGEYRGTFRRTGFFWVNPFITRKRISLRIRNKDIAPIKVNDKVGNPVMIGMVLVWKVNDTYRAVFDVDTSSESLVSVGADGKLQTTEGGNVSKGLDAFVGIQSDAALREVTGRYAYDEDGISHNEITLRSDGHEINEQLEAKLNERLAMAGIEVVEARLNYLAYAPEIAAVMLRRQQASAIISAREKIVEGAVSMVKMALDQLEDERIVSLDDERKAAMVSNLLVVLCADEPAQPVLNTGTLYQ
ncbi:MAG: SPFH domain-containing protein [Muribaculaceae bacterium]|nr:SPFH domain-containing protein [Muribaculaceae bacterium]